MKIENRHLILLITIGLLLSVGSTTFAQERATTVDWNGDVNATTITTNTNVTVKGNVNLKGQIKIKNGAKLSITTTGNYTINRKFSGTMFQGIYDGNAASATSFSSLSIDGGSYTLTIDGGAVFNEANDATSGLKTTPSYSGSIFECTGEIVLNKVTIQNIYNGSLYARSHADASAPQPCKITDCTFQGFYGGCIFYVAGPDYHTAQLKNVTFQNNDCTKLSGESYGSCVRANGNTRSSVTLKDCTILNNDVQFGTIHWNTCKLSTTNLYLYGSTEIANNRSTGTAGAIFNCGRMTLSSAYIHDNYSPTEGGAIRLAGYTSGAITGQGCSLVVSDSVRICDNSAGSKGGAIYMTINPNSSIGFITDGSSHPAVDAYFSLEVEGEISGNHAPIGGGVCIEDYASNKVYVAGWGNNGWSGTYIRNVKIKPGAKIYGNYTDAGVHSGEIYDQSGGGIYIKKYRGTGSAETELYNGTTNFGTLTVDISGGDVYQNVANKGNGTADYTGCGGALYLQNDFTSGYTSNFNVNVSGSAQIFGNEADNFGAGIYLDKGNFTMTGGSIGKDGTTLVAGTNPQEYKTNHNAAKDGGGFYIKGGSCSVKGGAISYNDANRNGGGFYVNPGSGSTTIINNESANTNINGNTASNGAGVYVASGNVTVSGATIESNTADTDGGGIYAVGSVTVNTDTKIQRNKAKGSGDTHGGGGIFINNGTFTMNAGTIGGADDTYANQATAGNGGGVYVTGSTAKVVIGSSGNTATIKHNTATSGKGGGLYVHSTGSDGTTLQYGATVESNSSINGGGIYANSGTVNINTGSISQNYALEKGGGIYIPSSGTLNLTGAATISLNHVPQSQLGGGVYLEGTVKAGSATNTSSNIIKVEDNYACNTVITSSDDVTAANRNNIYLPNPTDGDGTPDTWPGVITVVNNGLNLTDSKIGFSVPHNFIPVIYCQTATYLQPTIMNSNAIFEDSERYNKYYSSSSPYKANFIYLSANTWVTQVTSQPSPGFTIDGSGNVTISNENGLAWLISYVNGLNGVEGGEHDMENCTVTLTADLDMKANSWVPIGMTGTTDKPFKGTFNGNGHTVSNLYCSYLGEGNDGTGSGLGMFGVLDGATVHDVFLNGVELQVHNQLSGTFVMGAIANEIKGNTSIYNCTAASTMESTWSGTTMGGLVGKLTSGTIHSSAAMPDMTGYTMGGLVGANAGNIYNSFANAKFTYSGTNQYMGGLVAVNTGRVENCYSRIQGTAPTSSYFGYLAGNNTSTSGKGLYSCYATNTTYVATATGTTTGNQTSLNTYGTVVAPYLYNHSNDNLVGSTGINLCAMLNTWVQNTSNGWNNTTMTNANGYAQWKRTTAGGYSTSAGNINGDYPIHKYADYKCVASPDGIALDYAPHLYNILKRHATNATVNLYANDTTTASTGTNVVVYIDENVSLLQDVGKETVSSVIEAYTCQTLPGNQRSWHFLSSSLTNSGIGFNYSQHADFNWDPNPCGVTFTNGADDTSLFPTDLDDIAKIDLYAFYEPEYHWINLKRRTDSHWHMNATNQPINYTNETTLTPGKGYLVSIDKDQLLQNRGTLNNGEVEIALGYTPAQEWAGLVGYNLIGNPYQSYLDFSAFASQNSGLWYDGSKGKAVEPTYAVYDSEMGGYIQYKEGASRGSKSASGILNMHQGFMVRSSGATRAKFTNAMRTNDGNGVSFRGEQPAYPLINLTVTDDEGVNDFAVLELGRDRDEGAEKLRANDSKGWLYLHHGSENYGILFRSEVDGYQPLWFEADEAGSYTLSWETANAEFEALTLVDNITGVVTDMLAHGSYTFEATPEQYASRFKIVVGDYKDIEENEASEPVEGSTFAYVNNGNIVLAGLETEGEVSLQIIDMTGRVILCRDASHASAISTDGIASGIYILRLTDGKGTKIQKIVIE